MDLIINLNKPEGITSYKALAEVKKHLRAKKAGHAGTLDPSARGILVLCLNRATRLAPYFSGLDKRYIAVMKIGETTDTQDAEGRIIRKKNNINIDESLIKKILKEFEGNVMQTPPVFSAIKYRGKSLYKYARKGIEVPVKARRIHISSIELIAAEIPFITINVTCSKGTYIRTLCNDIGDRLGTGAHLYKLERIQIGPFSINDSIRLEEITDVKDKMPDRGIYTMDQALSWMPEYSVSGLDVGRVKNGAPIRLKKNHQINTLKTTKDVKVKSQQGELLAIGKYVPEKHIIKMDVVLNTSI
jgi:tRNA pseudouridine55 synthase